MTHINTNALQGASTPTRLSSSKCKLLIATILIAPLVAVGCSKEKSKSSASTVASSSSAVLPPAPPAPATLTQPETKKPVARKPVRKHSSMVRYRDDRFGLTFGYPRKYTLKNGDDLKSDSTSIAMNFVQPGGSPAVSVEVPKASYPGTDLASAFFQVNVHRNLSAAECEQFAAPQSTSGDKNAVQPVKIHLGDRDFQQVENINGESMKQVDTKYFHVFENNACYEFALGLTTEWDGSEDGVTLVDREGVFRRLENILASVKINTETAPAVASAPAALPPAQPEIVK